MTPLLIALLVFSTIDHPSLEGHPSHIRDALTDARNAFLNEPPGSATALAELAMVYQANNFPAAARQGFEEAAKLSPQDARWHYYLGLLAMQQGRFSEAQQAFEDSLTLNPDYQPARLRRAAAQLEQGDTGAAKASLTDLLEDRPNMAAAQAMAGKIALGSGNFEAAIGHFTRALELQPMASALANPLAMAYRGNGDKEQAARWLQRRGEREVALEDPLLQRLMSHSRSFNYFLSLGIEAAESGDIAAGIGFLNTARDIAPDNPNVLLTLARMLESQGELASGVEAVEQALRAAPDYALAMEQRGVLAEMQGAMEAAVGWYQKALSGDSTLYDARLLLANHLMRSGRHASAIEHLEMLHAAQPFQNIITLRLAVSLVEANRCGDAARLLDRRLRSQPEASLGLTFVRVVATCDTGQSGDKPLALNTARQLYAGDSGLEVTTALAMIEFATGSREAALGYQQQALFAAVRDGLPKAQQQTIQSVLAQYQDQKMPRRPWPDGHPITAPEPARPGDR
ncbi:MAG: tetratricopeptide repeat protein [Lysobacterales bacterium]